MSALGCLGIGPRVSGMSGPSGLVCAQVTITLTDKEGATELLLVQKEVPEEERERTEKGCVRPTAHLASGAHAC